MRKNISLLGLLLFLSFVGLNAQTPYYFYNCEGEKIYLSLNTKYVFLSLKEQLLPMNIQQHSVKTAKLQSDKSDQKQYQSQKGTCRFYTVLSFEEKMSDEYYLKLLSDMKHQNMDVIISPFFKVKDGDIVGLSNFFYVKLREERDTTLLRQMTKQTRTTIIEQDPFMPLWYVLSTTEVSEYNAMECSNLFYESGLFQAAEPDLMLHLLQCANDSYFGDQWGLKNTGQYGGISEIDIKACEAWQISKGDSVTVAIIDHGLELGHPDLQDNIHPLSYDTENRTSPSIVRGSHGVACAGIVGAVQNNSAGISGVAPNCKLMSISNSLTISTYDPNLQALQQQNLANGIDWARQKGADVISCSWGHSLLQGSFITDAITNAVTNGRVRNGVSLGCVVVFATGNNNAWYVSYPANLPNVIGVGAISPCGERKSPDSCDGESWGSNYGNGLDVVAPGVLIPTTDRQDNVGYNPNNPIHVWNGGNKISNDYTDQDYTVWFNGTSAACPHVAGVAALVLSVNPDLKQQEVREIISRTAQKVGNYTYQYYSFFPYGDFCYDMGYGLVDAYEAVKVTELCLTPTNFAGQTVASDITVEGCEIIVEDVEVTNNAKLTIDAKREIIFKGTFKAYKGAELKFNTDGW